MIGYIFAAGIIFCLIIITIISYNIFILTNEQIHTLWIGTILMILFSYIRSYLINLEPLDLYLFVPAGLFLIWYFLTKLTANLINKDKDSNIIRDTSL